MIPVRESLALFTVDLVAGRDGRIVLQLVEGVHKLEIVNVTTHHLNSLDLTVAILSWRTGNVMYFHVQWMGNTLHGATGRIVHQHAVVAQCFGQELVVIHLLNMAEGLVADSIPNMIVVTQMHVLLMADFQNGVCGLLVQTLAVEVHQVENGFVEIQNLSMVVITVRVCLRKLDFAIKYPVQLMVVSVNGICGLFVPFHVAVG